MESRRVSNAAPPDDRQRWSDPNFVAGVTMKRYIAAVLSILGVAAGVGWKLASHPETSLGLHEVSLKKNSERSLPSDAVARLRVRVSPSDLGYELRVSPDKVPQVSLAAK